MWTNSAPCFLKKKKKKTLKEMVVFEGGKGLGRKNERGNEQFRKKSKKTGFSKTKNKYK